MTKEIPTCPFCGKKQVDEPINTWNYGSVQVKRYFCKCKKKFNFYQSTKGSWTIPKSK